MALFCFPEEPAWPLPRSYATSVWRGGRREVMCLWEKKESSRCTSLLKENLKQTDTTADNHCTSDVSKAY